MGYFLTVLLLIFPLTCLGQESTTAEKQKISDSYGKAAIVALLGIGSDSSTGGLKITQEKIDAADAEGQSTAEVELTKVLRNIFVAKISDNSTVRTMGTTKNELSYKRRKKDPIVIPITEEPEFIQIGKNEMECFESFKEVLRDRGTSVPEVCSKMMTDSESFEKEWNARLIQALH